MGVFGEVIVQGRVLGIRLIVTKREGNHVLRTLTRTLGEDLVLRARVVPGIGTSVGSEEGLRVA